MMNHRLRYRIVMGMGLPLLLSLAACGGGTTVGALPANPISSTPSAPAGATSPATATPVPTPTTPAPATALPAPRTTAPPETTSPYAADADLPALAPGNAPPMPAAVHDAAEAPSSQPARLVIPALGMDLHTIPAGLDAQRVPLVPKHDIAWFSGSSMPGEGSNVVFWGHVLRWRDSPNVPAPFERIHELQPGADVTVITADGQTHRYRVTEQVQVQPDDIHLLFPSLGERVTLVSCIGDKVIRKGRLTETLRLVTIAELVR